MNVIFSHPTGNANVRAVATGFAQAELLKEFHTTLAIFPGSFLDRLSQLKIYPDFQRRGFDSILKSRTRTFPWKELGRLSASRMGLSHLTKHGTGPFCIDSVYKSLDRRVASRIKNLPTGIDAVYAYEDGAVLSFGQAKKKGLRCYYDLPTGYWRAAHRLLEKEKKRFPELASTIRGFKDSKAKLEQKDQEIKMADKVFVASSFSASTLTDFPGVLPPIQVIPYGFPPVVTNRSYIHHKPGKPIKFLFVGKLSQQKGIGDIFKAVKALGKHISLTIVGQKPQNHCRALDAELPNFKWYSSLAHKDVLKLMRTHDVLLFPSLFDGFGLVISEAMSQGMPVIASDRCAGPDLISNQENGWLIKAGSSEALKETIENILLNPDLIAGVGEMARKTAANRPWEVYQHEIIRAMS